MPNSEYLKSIISLKPIFSNGAFHEWNAYIAFHKNNLLCPDPIAVARTGRNTCILTLGIKEYIRASELFMKLSSSDRKRKKLLIKKIAEFTAKMHSANFSHQDFYLVHFFINENEDDSIYIIDLQRVIMQKKLSIRWIVKDLAQLLFSARPYVKKNEIMYFWKVYSDLFNPSLFKNKSFIRRIFSKSEKIKRRTNSK